MARKLEVSVVSTVVGARRDAHARFLDPRGDAAAAALASAASAWSAAVVAAVGGPWPDSDGGEAEASALAESDAVVEHQWDSGGVRSSWRP